MSKGKKASVFAVMLAVVAFIATPSVGMASIPNTHAIVLDRTVSQNAYHADAPALSPTGAMTIEAWVNLERLPNEGEHMGVVSKWTTTNCCQRSYNMGIVGYGGGTDIYVQLSSDGQGFVPNYLAIEYPATIHANVWHHIAFVFTPGSRMELFVDGVSIGYLTANVPAGIYDNATEFQIGALIDESGPLHFLDGMMDDVRLWGVARTQAEIISDKDHELVGDEPSLLGYWKFNGTALDETVNANHLSLRNGPTYFIEQPINHAPVFSSIGNQTVNEGEQLSFAVSAIDEDNDTLTYSASNLPSGAIFDPDTRVFSWTPSYSQEGNYPDIEFTVTDDGSPMELDVELITITVGNANRAPEFTVVGTQEVLENELLSFPVSATDPDEDGVSIVAANLPSGATFSAGVFAWTPTLAQSGNYVVTFVATDNGIPLESASLDVVITVGNNPTPVEQAEIIVAVVISYNFPTNVENSYLANLKKVQVFIEEGKITPALNQLEAFKDKVEADFVSGILTQEERDVLIDLADTLILAIG